jgi:hypothetical protein
VIKATAGSLLLPYHPAWITSSQEPSIWGALFGLCCEWRE